MSNVLFIIFKPRDKEMKKLHYFLLPAVLAAMASCGTTNSADLYDPNAPVAPISISTLGSVDPSDRSIALPRHG